MTDKKGPTEAQIKEAAGCCEKEKKLLENANEVIEFFTVKPGAVRLEKGYSSVFVDGQAFSSDSYNELLRQVIHENRCLLFIQAATQAKARAKKAQEELEALCAEWLASKD